MNYVSLHQQTGGFRTLAANAGYTDAYGGYYQIGFETTNIPPMFRVYVPRGATKLTIYIFYAQGSWIAGSMRFGDVPDNVSLALGNFLSYPYSNGEFGGLLDGKTYTPRPYDGSQTVINRNIRTPLPVGGWLNCRVCQVKGTPFKLAYSCQINKDVWPAWLGTVQWGPDGDPLEGQAPPPPPPPPPPPDPDPDPQAGTIAVTRGKNFISITVTWPEGQEMVMK